MVFTLGWDEGEVFLVRLGRILVFGVVDGGGVDTGDSLSAGDAVRLRFRVVVVAEVDGDKDGVEGNSGTGWSTCRDRSEREVEVGVALMLDRVRFLILSGASSPLAALFLCAAVA